MTTLTLFQIAAEYRHITDVLQDSGVDEQTLADTLEGEAWPLELKAQNYGFVIRNIEANVFAMKNAEEQIEKRRKAAENRITALKERLKLGLEIAGVQKIECPEFSISIKKNPASVEIYEAGLIPSEFMKQAPLPPPTIDKTAIKNAINSGKEVTGAKIVQGMRIEIK